MENNNILKTLDKGLLVMSYLARLNRSTTIEELSQLVNINKSTTFRILQTLAKHGFVHQYRNSSYILSIDKFQNMINNFDADFNLRSIARPTIQKLSRNCNETIILSSFTNCKAECIDQITSNSPVYVGHLIGRFYPLHIGATGKSVLAFLKKEEIESYIESVELSSNDNKAIKNNLYKELEEIKIRGYATSHAELDYGLSAISAPIFNKEDNVIGTVSILGITETLSNQPFENYGCLVVEAGKEISEQLK